MTAQCNLSNGFARSAALKTGTTNEQSKKALSSLLRADLLWLFDGSWFRRRQERQQHQRRDPKSGDRQFGWQVHDQTLDGKTGESEPQKMKRPGGGIPGLRRIERA